MATMFDRYELKERIEAVVRECLKAENLVLVDLEFKPRGKKRILRILVDEPAGGISLDRCAGLNNAISQLLDREDLIQGSYLLEVSSPGMDRPLVTREDFARCLNRKIRIFLNVADGQVNEIAGIIISVTEAGLDLDSGSAIQKIPFEQIRKAKQIIEASA